METRRLQRRLMAILAADAVSYSRMMEEDEERTLRILGGHRELIDPLIAGYGGHIVSTAGDSVLAEFASAVDAVRCAIEMQDAIRGRNEKLLERERMWFRVGVNLGDVIVSDTDVHGDGVNVAVRLESIAAPGGVCISSGVYDQISGKLNLGFADMGEQSLKNISRPVRAYRFAGPLPTLAPRTVRRRGPRRGWAWGVVTGLVVVGLAAAWHAGMLSSTRWDAGVESVVGRDTPGDVESERARSEAGPARDLAGEKEARRRAEAEAMAAAEARKALEQDELAAARARADAELARARAEAAAITDAAEAEAQAIRRAASRPEAETPEPETQPVHRFDGEWIAQQRCEPWKRRPAAGFRAPASIRGGTVQVERRFPSGHGYVSLQGRVTGEGDMNLFGSLVPAREEYGSHERPVQFEGRVKGEGFLLEGYVGRRPCTLQVSRVTR